VQNLFIRQRVLPRVDDAEQVNVGAKVTQRPLGLVWRRRLSRSTELVYGVVNLRDDEVGIHVAALITAPARLRSASADSARRLGGSRCAPSTSHIVAGNPICPYAMVNGPLIQRFAAPILKHWTEIGVLLYAPPQLIH
jgi:hypothetical protein